MTSYSESGSMLPVSRYLLLTLSLQDDSLYVGSDVLNALGRPRQLQMLINEEDKKILIQACTIYDREAVVVPPQPTLFFQISGQSLLKKIKKLMKWEGDQARVLCGQKVPGYHAIEFDLETAERVEFDGRDQQE